VRVVVLAVVVSALAGCGAAKPVQPDRPVAQTRAVSAAFTRACARTAGIVEAAVLCPAVLPVGGFEAPRNYGDGRCAYLLNLEPRAIAQSQGPVTHLLFGGSCTAWDLRTRAGRWPAELHAASMGDELRLVGTTSLVPGQTEADRRRVGLRVLRATRVRSAPALVLRNPPYPVGGIHGGHVTVIWNAGGAGYAVSGHPAMASRRVDGSVTARACPGDRDAAGRCRVDAATRHLTRARSTWRQHARQLGLQACASRSTGWARGQVRTGRPWYSTPRDAGGHRSSSLRT